MELERNALESKSSDLSYVIVLHPRPSTFPESSSYSTDFMRSSVELERDKWKSRKDFFFTTLSFCLSLANLWRFPRQAYKWGQGSFVMLYVIFTLVFGSSFLFFEVALGQYSTKGFMKVFGACPIFEGISYSMLAYCAFLSVNYSFINVATLVLLFASLDSPLQYSKCVTSRCGNTTKNSDSPEFEFYTFNIRYNELMDENLQTTGTVNWRNIGILFVLWLLIGIAILAGVRTRQWPYKIHCPTVYVVLLVTLGVTFLLKGSQTGLFKFFVPTVKDITDIQTWVRAFEQMILSLGLGIGPLLNFASYLNFQCRMYIDTSILCFCVMISSLLSGMTCFAILGVLSEVKQVPMDTLFVEGTNRDNYINPLVVFSQLFTMLPQGCSQCLAVTLYSTFLVTGWLSLVGYSEIIFLGLSEFLARGKDHKVALIFSICFVLFLLGASMEDEVGINFMLLVHDHIVGTTVLLILLFVFLAISYLYGVYTFCDEIEFMLGFYPYRFFQFTWMSAPVILGIMVTYDFIDGIENRVSWLEALFSFGLALSPIIARMLFNVYYFHKRNMLSHILLSRDAVIFGTNEDTFLGE